jgi:hypothetical protein
MATISRNGAQIVDDESVLNQVAPTYANLAEGSAYHALVHAGNIHASKEVTLNPGGAAAQNENFFTITGVCRIRQIHGRVTQATDSTTFSSVSFDVDDGAAQDPITSAAGVDGSGCVVGDIFIRNNKKTAAAAYIDTAAAGSVLDPGLNDAVLTPFIVNKKDGQTTYIRFNYTSDINTDVDMEMNIEYEPISDDGVIAAV